MLNPSPDEVTGCSNRPSHYCPQCLRRVGAAELLRRVHRETYASGALDVLYLHCPSCGLVLATEVDAAGLASSWPASGGTA